MWLLPAFAIVTGTFSAGLLLRFFLANRNPVYLAWSFSLILFAVASACAFVGSYDGWTETTARIYYLAGVTLFTGFMSLGTVYLNAPRVIGHAWLAILLAIAVLAGILLAGTGIDAAALALPDEPGWRAVEASTLLVGIVSALSSVGTLIMVVAAVAGLVYRRAGWEQTQVAAGVLLVGLGGALARLDGWEWSSLGQAAGVLVILLGALRLTRTGVEGPAP